MSGSGEKSTITIRHSSVPGRLRLAVAGLHRRPEQKEPVEQLFLGIAGVSSASANPTTGNVLVLFDPDQCPSRVLLASAARALQARQNGTGRAEEIEPTAAPFHDAGEDAAPPREPRDNALARPFPPSSPADSGATSAAAIRDRSEPWHALPAPLVARQLAADPERGLDPTEADARRRRHGPNRLPEPKEPSLLALLSGQFLNAPAALLGAGALLSLGTGAVAEAALIGGVLVANAAIGAFSERSGQRAIAALRRTVPIQARVVRDGSPEQVDADQLVPGDTVELLPGEPLPADARLLDAHRLQVEESALTGESHAVTKSARPVDITAPLADRQSMVYRGTTVVGGYGRAVVVATGSGTVLGELRALAAQSAPPPTPIERDLELIGRQMVAATSTIILGVLGLGLLRGAGLVPSLTSAIALGIAAVPEALPALATTVLSLSSGRMRKRGTLIRSLSAAEALGSITVVCADKTGTLTENRMAVGEIRVDGQPIHVSGSPLSPAGHLSLGRRRILPQQNAALSELLKTALLCSDAEVAGRTDGELSIDGSPTEGALLVMGLKAGLDLDGLRERYPRVDRRDRGEGRRHMITIHRGPEGLLALAKGAPDELLDLCDRRMVDGETLPMTGSSRAALSRRNADMAARAMRVLAFAGRDLPEGYGEEHLGSGFTWFGLVGLMDPLRPAAPEAVEALRQAGIRTVMITGDQAATAVAVARDLGLERERPLHVLEAGDLAALDPEMLRGLVPNVEVFARVPPELKLAVVRALQANGEIVAMTGDGVNDAPALRAADVGVAMGRRGTELARELADVVLSTDDLSKMVEAVEEGRLVRANIRRVLHYLLTTNASEVWAVGTAGLLGLPPPFTAGQLLWVNLVSDLFPVLGLAMEPRDADLMARPPRDPAEPILPPSLRRQILAESATIAAGSLTAYGAGLLRHGPGPAARTMSFWSLIAAQLMHVPLARAGRQPALRYGRPLHRPLVLGVGASTLLQLAAAFLPPLRSLLGGGPLGLLDGLISLVAAGTSIAAIEAHRLATNPAPAVDGARPVEEEEQAT